MPSQDPVDCGARATATQPLTKRLPPLSTAPPLAKYVLVPAILGLGAFGFWATMLGLARNGMGLLLMAVADGQRANLVGAPSPFRRRWTGFGPLDRELSLLNAFFSALLDGGDAVPPRTVLFNHWAVGQFAAGWTVVLLEGLRAGSRGRAVGRILLFGVVVQRFAWTTALPLWLALHLLTSPVARLRDGDGPAARGALLVRLWDLALLPASVTASLLLPSAMMACTGWFVQSASTRWSWLTAFQVFPVVNVTALLLLRRLFQSAVGPLQPRDDSGAATALPGRAYLGAVRGVYQFALTLLVLTHLPIFSLTLLPPGVRSTLAMWLHRRGSPSYGRYVAEGTFWTVFVPSSAPFSSVPPTVGVGVGDDYGPGHLAPFATDFLQYDILTAAVPLLLWAVYLRYRSAAGGASLAGLGATGARWFLLGGPYAAAIALLWERDEAVLRDDEREEEEEEEEKEDGLRRVDGKKTR